MIRESDASKPLVDYLEKNLKKGYKVEELKWALVSQKHSKIEIEKALKLVLSKMPIKSEITHVPLHEIKQETIIIPETRGFWNRIFG